MMSDGECCLEMYDDMGSVQEYGDLRTEKLRATSPPPMVGMGAPPPPPMVGMEAPPPPPMLEMGAPPPPPPPPPTNAYHTAKKKSLQIAPLPCSMPAMGGRPPPHTPMMARMRGAPWHRPQGMMIPQSARMAKKSAPPPPPAQMLGMGAPPMPGMAAPPPPPAPPIRPQMAMMKPAREPQPLSAQMAQPQMLRMAAPPPPPRSREEEMLASIALLIPPRDMSSAAGKSFKVARKISPPAMMARMRVPQTKTAPKPTPLFSQTEKKSAPPPPPAPPKLAMEAPIQPPQSAPHFATIGAAQKSPLLYYQLASNSAPPPPPPPELGIEAQQGSSVLFGASKSSVFGQPQPQQASPGLRTKQALSFGAQPLQGSLFGAQKEKEVGFGSPERSDYGAQQGPTFGASVGSGYISRGETVVFGAPAGSAFGARGGSGFGAPAGSGFGAPAGSRFHAPPGSGFGTPTGSVFGARGGSGLSAPAGSGFGAPAGSGFTMRSGSVFGGGYGFGAPAGSDVGEQSGSVFGAPPTFDLPPAPSAGVELSSGHSDLRFAPDLPQSQPQSAGKGHLSQVNKGGVSLRQSDDTPELTRVSNEAKIKADVEEIKMMMRDNIDKALERSQCLESLESKSASFKKMSTQRKKERATQDLQTVDIIMDSSMSSPQGLTEETGVSWRKSSVKEIERGKKKKKAQVQQPVSEAISEPVESRSRESHWRSRGFQAVVGKRAGLRSRALRAKADLECDDVEEDHDEEVEPFIQDEGEWDADLDLLGDAYGDEGEKEEEEEDDDMGYALFDCATSRQGKHQCDKFSKI